MINKVENAIAMDAMFEKDECGDQILDIWTTFDIVDSEGQRLKFRVGPVFFDEILQTKRGLWIYYQEKHEESQFCGPFLMSEANFNELVIYVRRKFTMHRWYRRFPAWIKKLWGRARKVK